jgi:hypothetical protein
LRHDDAVAVLPPLPQNRLVAVGLAAVIVVIISCVCCSGTTMLFAPFSQPPSRRRGSMAPQSVSFPTGGALVVHVLAVVAAASMSCYCRCQTSRIAGTSRRRHLATETFAPRAARDRDYVQGERTTMTPQTKSGARETNFAAFRRTISHHFMTIR